MSRRFRAVRKPKITTATRNRVQLYDNQWSPIYNKGYHECCDCSLVHSVKYRLYDGVLFEMWTRNKSETAKARRKKGKR